MNDFYKMDPGAWDFGTANLSLEEEAAYLRIINAMHKHRGPVPHNDRVIAGLFRVSARKARALVAALIEAGKIHDEGGFLTNERAEKDLIQRGFVSNSRSESGANGGRVSGERRANILKNNNQLEANASPREEKRREEKKEEDKSSLSFRPENDDLAGAFEAYNETAKLTGWPQVKSRTKARSAALKARLSECGGIDGWRAALAKARASPHLCGQNKIGWTASFDFLTTASSFTKLIEGNYDPRTAHPTGPRAPSANAAFGAAIHQLADGLSAGTVRIDNSRSDPFAKRSG